jgi:hypothetical protein
MVDLMSLDPSWQAIGRGMSYAEAKARLRQNLFRQILSSEVQIGSPSLFPPLPGIDFPVSG